MEELPIADVDAFSIDDSTTTEVDDAASIEHLEGGITRVGIHIAAPALMIQKDSPLDAVAKTRMSTVYAPGLKTTMLPESWIKASSLDEGHLVPCISLYVWVKDDTFAVERTETRLERIALKANLRYDKIDDLVTEEAIAADALTIPYAHEIAWLWHFANVCSTAVKRCADVPNRRDAWIGILRLRAMARMRLFTSKAAAAARRSICWLLN